MGLATSSIRMTGYSKIRRGVCDRAVRHRAARLKVLARYGMHPFPVWPSRERRPLPFPFFQLSCLTNPVCHSSNAGRWISGGRD